jgi:hypothetical protein
LRSQSGADAACTASGDIISMPMIGKRTPARRRKTGDVLTERQARYPLLDGGIKRQVSSETMRPSDSQAREPHVVP